MQRRETLINPVFIKSKSNTKKLSSPNSWRGQDHIKAALAATNAQDVNDLCKSFHNGC